MQSWGWGRQRTDTWTLRAFHGGKKSCMGRTVQLDKKSGQRDSLWNKCQEGDELFSVQRRAIQRISMERSVLAARGFKHRGTHTRTLPASESELAMAIPPGKLWVLLGLQHSTLGRCQECELGRDVRFEMWPGLGGLLGTPSSSPFPARSAWSLPPASMSWAPHNPNRDIK